MYLTQMGEIPLLDPRAGNRPGQEDRGHPQAVPPQGARVRLRPRARSSTTLKQVHAGELPFDRTVKVSLTENLEKDKILGRMPHNLRDARAPDGAERRRLPAAASTQRTDRGRPRRAPPAASSIRRRKAVTLVEELSIRTQKVQPLMKKLEQIASRMDELEQPDRGPAGPAAAARKTGPTWRRSSRT